MHWFSNAVHVCKTNDTINVAKCDRMIYMLLYIPRNMHTVNNHIHLRIEHGQVQIYVTLWDLLPHPRLWDLDTVYPNKYVHGFVVLCFVVVMQSFIMNSHEVFIHIQQGCFAGTGAIVRLPQCQWSKPDGYGKISQCITTTKHSKGKTVCIFLGYTVCDIDGLVQDCSTSSVSAGSVVHV